MSECEVCGRVDCQLYDKQLRFADCWQKGYERLRTGYDARGLMIKGYEEEIEKLIREKDDLRASLTTAEKARDAYRRVAEIRSALLEGDDKPFREEIATAEKERDESRNDCARLLKHDLPAARAALEKALGALRVIAEPRLRWRTLDQYAKEFQGLQDAARAALSGGAHVDGPKAPSE